MNCVSLIGRLVRDPELRYAQTGTAMCRFTIAVDRRMSKQKRQEAQANNQQTADFIGCTAFGQTAELIANYHRKGSQIGLEGRIQTGSYEKEGRTIYTTDVVVENTEFAESKASDSSNSYHGGGYEQPSARPEPTSAVGDGFMNIPDGVAATILSTYSRFSCVLSNRLKLKARMFNCPLLSLCPSLSM